MWTGLLGTSLLFLIDMVWCFSGPTGWGNNGECALGNTQLSMIAKIVRVKHGTTSDTELTIPESALVTCANVSGSTDQFKICVRWSWESESIPSVPTNHTTKSHTTDKQTSTFSPTDPTTTKLTTKGDPTNIATIPAAKSLEKHGSEDTVLDINDASTESGISTSGTSEEPNETSTTDEITKTSESSWTPDVPETTADVSAATTDSSTTTNDVTTEDSTSTLDAAISTTSVPVPSIESGGSEFQPTVAGDDTETGSKMGTQNQRAARFGVSSKGVLRKLKEPPEVIRSCYPYCESAEEAPYDRHEEEAENRNLLSFTLEKSNSLFHVSDLYIRYELPGDEGFRRVYWKNVKLFPGPLDATHVCEKTPLKLPLTSRTDLVFQSIKLAAFLPRDHSEFPESYADCNRKYEQEEGNQFCKTAEITMITVGAILGVLLLSGLAFYIGKLYCQSKHEREARDTLPK